MALIKKPFLRLGVALALVVAAAFAAVGPAGAISSDDDGIVAAGEVIDDDLFMSFDQVTMDGTVNGNLFVSAGRAVINGTVNGNLIITSADATLNGVVTGSVAYAGKNLVLNGPVSGSLFYLGSSLDMGRQASLGRNLYFTGFSLHTLDGSTIARDVQINAYQGMFDGTVEGDITADLSALELNGSVGGDVTAKVGKPEQRGPKYFAFSGMPHMIPTGIRVSKEAQIGGVLDYTSQVDQGAAILAAPAGGLLYHIPVNASPQASMTLAERVRLTLLERVRSLITLLILGFLVLWKAPQLLETSSLQARKVLPAAGHGVLAVIAGYLCAFALGVLVVICGVLLLVAQLGELSGTVFGLGMSSVSLAFTIFSLLVSHGSKLVVCYLIGKWVVTRTEAGNVANRYSMLLLGVLLYLLVRSIPILGVLIGIIVTLVGLGAIWLAFQLWWAERKPAPPLAVEQVEAVQPA